MLTVTFQIYLEEPLLVTGIDGEPNSKTSLDYIPGAVIRGALIGAYLRENRLASRDLSKNEAGRRLFFSNGVHFLNGYVNADAQTKRSLPTPRFLQKPKYEISSDISSNLFKTENVTTKKLKPTSAFSVIADSMFYAGEVRKQVAIHTTRDRDKGRATKEVGDLFRYEAIASDQTFQAAILCANNQDAEILQALLDQKSMAIGGARSAGYGRVTISEVKLVENWVEHPMPDTEKIALVMASDVILRDKWGEYRPDLETLLEHFGLTTCEKSAIRTTVHGGFNRTWGMEIPQTPAIQMGSYLYVNVNDLNTAKLTDILINGIGERRNEGFGRVYAMSPQPKYTQYKVEEPETIQPVTLTLPDHIKARNARQQSEKEVLEKASTYKSDRKRTSNSQLNSVRQMIATQLQTKDGKLDGFREELGKRKSKGRKQLENATVEKQSLFDWLCSLNVLKSDRETLEVMDIVLALMAKENVKDSRDV